ncbi:hypothetical protein [Pengzhenrongella phosphoraccumulans]|uniref:hypothetical protein n=1 Tax=Pengzhenrongella phosphoraccumulans TaxID=3114394 RepID=UPI00388D9C1C
MTQDYNWIDDAAHERRSTAVFAAADVTDEILGLARSLEDEWFSRDVWIDWSSFFADLSCVVIPSTGRELDFGIEPGSPAKDRVQRHIRMRRMASIARWKLAADRTILVVDSAAPALRVVYGGSSVSDLGCPEVPDTSWETW